MRRFLILATLVACSFAALAANAEPLWLRYPSISPDGSQIVFAYRGDLYRVPTGGGSASQLTQHVAHDHMPVWSRDGKSIAFASDRHGNFDVFQIPSEGGRATRLTFHSAHDYPSDFTPDGKRVLFSSTRMDAHAAIGFPTRSMPELYSAPVGGGAVMQILTTPAEDARYNADGRLVAYHDRKGYENIWRKHHTSSIARDIWVYDTETKTHTKMSDFDGEDRNPVWGGGELLYLSERGGSFNVWRTSGEETVAVTNFKHHPVRFLTRADNGALCFSYHGEVFTIAAGEKEPAKIGVTIPADDKENHARVTSSPGPVTDIAVSPNGKELAYIARGEVFVTSLDHKSTKRITNTPWQERSVSFHPDGRKLLYASERDGSWNLYETAIARDVEKFFYLSTVLEETPLLASGEETFQPQYSPDGSEVAFLEERTTLRIIDVASKVVRTVLGGDRNYSYSDGDQSFHWSPDGKWLLANILGVDRWVEDVALIPASGGEPTNLTQSGYFDVKPQWVLGGKAMLWFSDRHGMRSHGSWGSQDDVYAMFFAQDAYDRFRLSEEEYALEKEAAAKKKKDDDKSDKSEKKKGVEPVAIDLEGIEDRRVRLTIHSSSLGGAVLVPEGDRLFYLAKFEGGYDLWSQDFYKKETKLITKFAKAEWSGRGSAPKKLLYNAEKKELIVLSGGGIFRVDTEKGDKKKVDFGAEMTVDRASERAYMFEHAWRQVKKKFYVPDLHGVDWDFYKTEYAKFLPHIDNNYDFAEMLSELLGELNASHTGSGYRPKFSGGDVTAALGVFLDPNYRGAGVRIIEVMDRSPVIKKGSKIAPGTVIEKIDGETIAAGANHFPLLNRKAGKRTLLSLRSEATGERWEEVVKPISLGAESSLLYKRWVTTRRDAAEKLSGGRIGYVHIKGMNDASFREIYSDVFGKHHGKDAIVVDTRFNGGGWLHDDLVTFLSGVDYIKFYPRKQGNLGSEPQFKWSKPSIVLVGESNYSDAHMFPFAYKELGVGQLVGMPIPGTGTAVWWETLIDSTVYFGIPQVGMLAKDGTYLENTQLEPDIKVANSPEATAAGEDTQLVRAVEELLSGLDR